MTAESPQDHGSTSEAVAEWQAKRQAGRGAAAAAGAVTVIPSARVELEEPGLAPLGRTARRLLGFFS
jgi:hypothetical protein